MVGAGSDGERLTRTPLGELVDDGSSVGVDGDGLAGAVLDSPEVIEGTVTVVPVPNSSARESLSTDPTLSLDGTEGDGVINVVGSGEDTVVAEQALRSAEGLSSGVGGERSGGGHGLEEGDISSGEEGLETNGVFESADNRASGRGAEANSASNDIEGSNGINVGGSGEGGDQGTSCRVEIGGFEHGTSIIGFHDKELILVDLETFRDADSDTVGEAGRIARRNDLVTLEGVDGVGVGEEGHGAGGVGRGVVAGLLLLFALSLVGVLAESGDAVSTNEFASGVAGAAVGITEGRARFVSALASGGVGGVGEPLTENHTVALALSVDGTATGLDDAITRVGVELAASVGAAGS